MTPLLVAAVCAMAVVTKLKSLSREVGSLLIGPLLHRASGSHRKEQDGNVGRDVRSPRVLGILRTTQETDGGSGVQG